MPSLVIMTVWGWLGFDAIIYLAALQGVPHELVEAAAVDGASRWTIFRRVTLPLLGPATLLLVVWSTISAVQLFDEVFFITRGGPLGRTSVPVFYIYKLAFTSSYGFGAAGYAAALAYVLFVVIFYSSPSCSSGSATGWCTTRHEVHIPMTLRSADRALSPVDVALRVAIVGLALSTGYIHSTLGGVLFTLNAIGYLVAAVAMVIPLPLAVRYRWVVRLGLMGYAATTIIGWAIQGPYYTTAYIAKAIEVVLITLARDRLRPHGRQPDHGHQERDRRPPGEVRPPLGDQLVERLSESLPDKAPGPGSVPRLSPRRTPRRGPCPMAAPVSSASIETSNAGEALASREGRPGWRNQE